VIARATDATFINAVVNHPAVRPFVHGPDGPLDLTAVVKNPNHLVLTGAHGGMVMVQHVPGVFELHTQILPEGRGAWALQMAQECVDWLFCKTNATEVFTRVPKGNVPAMALSRACGAKPEERVRQSLGGEVIEVEILGGRIQDWIKIAPGLVERGQLFHERLKQRAAEAGVAVSNHPEDPWHDRHVGAAAGMMLGGQPIKGALVFNRWAAMALAPPMRIVSLTPLILDITDCCLEVAGDDFTVIPNRVH
jgi:hypothetical protein